MHQPIRRILLGCCLAFILSPKAPLAQDRVFWTATGNLPRVSSAELTGTNVQDLIRGVTLPPLGVDIDTNAGKIYWCGSTTIHRSNLDGTQIESVVTGQQSLLGLALDVNAQRIYFTTDAAPRTIKRANMDGSGVTTLLSSASAVYQSIAVDPGGGKMYWANLGSYNISRANLDGSSPELLQNTTASPVGIALDVAAGKVYWTQQDRQLKRCNLDGSSPEVVHGEGGVFQYEAVALDLVAGKIYWERTDNTILRCNLDGSGVEAAFPSTRVFDLVVDETAGVIYWTNSQQRRVYRANTDGSGQVAIVKGLVTPSGIAAHSSKGKIYFTDATNLEILSANLDGSALAVVLNTTQPPRDLALDESAGKLYWTESASVRRANLDGSGAETVLSGLESSQVGLGIDPAGNRLFVAEAILRLFPVQDIRGKIKRANLDGSNLTTILNVTNAGYVDVAFSSVDDRIYIADDERGLIQRADASGGNFETIVTGASSPTGIVVCTRDQRIYWASRNQGRILRSSLDGTGLEVLVTGIGGPLGVALYKESPLPTLLRRSHVERNASSITLVWEVSSFVDEERFVVMRRRVPDTEFKLVDQPVERMAEAFRLTDSAVVPSDEYQYRVYLSEDTPYLLFETPVVDRVLSRTELLQNYPNPFNPSTTIRFTLSEEARAKLDIYAVTGAFVVRLEDATLAAGTWNYRWDGKDQAGENVGSGVYFYQLEVDGKRFQRKMVMVR